MSCLALERAANGTMSGSAEREVLLVDQIVGAGLAFISVVFLLSVLGLRFLLPESRLAEE